MVYNSIRQSADKVVCLTVFALLLSIVIQGVSKEACAQVSYYQRIPHVCLKEATPRDNLWYTCINRPWWVDLKVGDEDKWVNDTGVPSPYEAVVRVDLVHAVGDYMQTLGSVGLNQGLTCVGNEKVEPVICSGRINVNGSPWLSSPATYPIVFRGVDLASKGDDRWLMQQGQPPNQSESEELCVGLETEGHCGVNGTIFHKDFKVFEATLIIDSGLPGTSCDKWICANENVNIGKSASVRVDLEPDVPDAVIEIYIQPGSPIQFKAGSPVAIKEGQVAYIEAVWPGDGLPLESYQYTISPSWKGMNCGDWETGTIFLLREKFNLSHAMTSEYRPELTYQEAHHTIDERTDCWYGDGDYMMGLPPQEFHSQAKGGSERCVSGDVISATLTGRTDYLSGKLPHETFELDWAGEVTWTGLLSVESQPQITCPLNADLKGALKWYNSLSAHANSNRIVPPFASISVGYGVFSLSPPTPAGSSQASSKSSFSLAGITSNNLQITASAETQWTSDEDKSPSPLNNAYTHVSFGTGLSMGEVGGDGVSLVCTATSAAVRKSESEVGTTTLISNSIVVDSPFFVLH